MRYVFLSWALSYMMSWSDSKYLETLERFKRESPVAWDEFIFRSSSVSLCAILHSQASFFNFFYAPSDVNMFNIAAFVKSLCEANISSSLINMNFWSAASINELLWNLNRVSFQFILDFLRDSFASQLPVIFISRFAFPSIFLWINSTPWRQPCPNKYNFDVWWMDLLSIDNNLLSTSNKSETFIVWRISSLLFYLGAWFSWKY